MEYEGFRREFNEYRLRLVFEANRNKEMNEVWINLGKTYANFGAKQKEMVPRVLGEWLESDDDGQRSDAEYLITNFNIPMAKEPVERLARRLAMSSSPAARHELETVQRILRG